MTNVLGLMENEWPIMNKLMKSKNELKIQFPSHPCWLQYIRLLVKEVCLNFGFSKTQTHGLVLAVDEACANIIKHSYCGCTDGLMTLECRGTKKALEFILKDKGRAVDCRKIQHRPLDEVRPGGLGVFFIQKMMDEVQYRRSGGMNILRMKKYAEKG